jgi:large subunit ribosomal protein L23
MTATKKYASEQLMTVLLAPVVSRVADAATKPEIKAAIELLFKVKVSAVKVANVKGKQKRFGRSMGRRRNWRKAYVCLAPGQEINFASLE